MILVGFFYAIEDLISGMLSSYFDVVSLAKMIEQLQLKIVFRKSEKIDGHSGHSGHKKKTYTISIN
jgi:hypothetical protein